MKTQPAPLDSTTSESKLRATLGASAVRVLDWSSILAMIPMGYVLWVQSTGVEAGWLTSYGADCLGTAWVWWWLRRTLFVRAPWPTQTTALAVLAAGVAWKVNQRYDLSGTQLAGTKGTYDPFDLVAYAATLAGCYSLEQVLRRRVAARTARADGPPIR